ncbi:hypothetical protein SV7mr_29860 [Stieleria bergensis]|uniref:Sulfatase n=2 Tax=Stieleria bergensis TaxID=2528025 RepID=A0A517SWK9_9BACT|nr:hypothetical protein SV7mr_29860 [Planctomycetes bacterium SV_7m_r]
MSFLLPKTRRQILQQSAIGFGGLAMQALLAGEATSENPLIARQPHFKPRAKRIVFLFMKGGPSHVDTFDPKPLLDRDHGKPLPFAGPKVTFAKQGNLLRSPWKFQQHGDSGLPVSELFPQIAKQSDKLCVLRSVHGTNPAHGAAALKLHTGAEQLVRPSFGSWITYGLGTENQNLPGFITICPTLAHGGVNNWGSAFLPSHCQGTPIGNASLPATQANVKYIDNPHLSLQQQREQIDLIRNLSQPFQESTDAQEALDSRLNSFELAFRMQTAMPEIQDLSQETTTTRSLYGIDDAVTEDFGRQCLMARRFLERDVRFVQVTHSDSFVQWDQHSNLYQGHTKNAAEVDRPIAGLLQDLESRGLLEDTLVLWGGEFGRTPTSQGNNGRDHNPHGFTMWMAGGGVKGGFAYGATDDYGYYAAENKMHVHDLHATILHLLGLNHQRLTYRYAGRDFRLTDVAGVVAKDILA